MLMITQTALELGFLYALVAMALFLSFRILNIADMTTDGCFVLGAAVSVTLAAGGHPILAIPAAMLAGSRRLGNLIAFTDYNKMQLDGYIEEVNGLYPLDKKWEAFGWHVQSVDGHDVAAISHAIDNAQKITDRPSMILLDTVKGKGGYFCENQVASHNMNITGEMWQKAVALLDEEDA